MGNYAIIPAAGGGTRMGGSVPKQFLDIAGETILARTLRVFGETPEIEGVYVVIPPDQVESLQRELSPRFPKVRAVIAGGEERQDSVVRGFAALPPCEVVCVHDGVRPFLRVEDLRRVLQVAREKGAAVLGRPLVETIKKVNARGLVQKTVDRKNLWSIQTPQCFRYEILMEALKKAQADGFRGTDEAMLVEYVGFPVTVLEGDSRNIKITTPLDLQWAQLFLEGKQ